MSDEADSFKNAGNEFFKNKEFGKAYKKYKEGLQRNQDHPQLHCNASAAAFNLGLYRESEMHAVKAFEGKRNYEKAYVRAIKAAQTQRNLVRQVDYILQGMQNCRSSDALLDAAEHMQHILVVSSFNESAEGSEFFKQPRADEKLAALEDLINEAKTRKESAPEHSDEECSEGLLDLFSHLARKAGLAFSVRGGKSGKRSCSKFSRMDDASRERVIRSMGMAMYTQSKGGIGRTAAQRAPPQRAPPPPKNHPELPRGSPSPAEKKLKTGGSVLKPPQEPKRVQQLKQPQDSKKVQEANRPQDPKRIPDPKQNHDLKSIQEPKQTQDPKRIQEPKQNQDSKKIQAPKQPQDSKKIQAPKQPQDVKKIQEAKQNEDAKKVEMPKQLQDSKKIQEAKQTQEQALRTSIVQEVMTLLKNGREAYKNSFFPVAATYLTRAQTLVQENSLEDLQEFVLFKLPLNYVICEAKVSSGTYKDLEEAILSLRTLVEGEGTRKFPAGDYLLGVAYIKLNRFAEARQQLEKVNALLSSNVNFNTYPWPGTFDVINATKKTYLETVVKKLLRHCGASHKPNWVCLFDECEKISSHIIPSRKIYFNDPDFTGYVELTCGAKCCLVFHCLCWRAYKEQSSMKRPTDKAILGEPCLTPDCESIIIGIVTLDKDCKPTHRDSIPFEPPEKKRNSESEKSNDSAVPKPPKAKKLKSTYPRSGSPSVKSTLPAERGTDEVKANDAETKDIDFEAELQLRKTKLENIRNNDKGWKHFNLDSPISTEFELVDEEIYVESFFEEVLKNEGPIHVRRVEDFYRENKVFIEQAVPAFRNFRSLLDFLLNRSHRFVLMDSTLGLATDLVDLYKMTKENVTKRVKLPRPKKSQDLALVTTNGQAVNDEAGRNNRNLELPRSTSPGYTDSQKLVTIESKPSLISPCAAVIGNADQRKLNQINTSLQVPAVLPANQQSAKVPSQIAYPVLASANQQPTKGPVQTENCVPAPSVVPIKEQSAKGAAQTVSPVPATPNLQSAKGLFQIAPAKQQPANGLSQSAPSAPAPTTGSQQSTTGPVQIVTAKQQSARELSQNAPSVPAPTTGSQQSATRPLQIVTAKQQSAKGLSQNAPVPAPTSGSQQPATGPLQIVTAKQPSAKGLSQNAPSVPARTAGSQQSATGPPQIFTAKQQSARLPQTSLSVPASANQQSAKAPHSIGEPAKSTDVYFKESSATPHSPRKPSEQSPRRELLVEKKCPGAPTKKSENHLTSQRLRDLKSSEKPSRDVLKGGEEVAANGTAQRSISNASSSKKKASDLKRCHVSSSSDGYDTDSSSGESFKSIPSSSDSGARSPSSYHSTLGSRPSVATCGLSISDSSESEEPTAKKPRSRAATAGEDLPVTKTAEAPENFVLFDDVVSLRSSGTSNQLKPRENSLKNLNPDNATLKEQMSKPPVEQALKKNLLGEPLLFQDLFVIEDSDKHRVCDVPVDLPPVEMLIKDFHENEDLFAIDEKPWTECDDLFDVPESKLGFSRGFEALKPFPEDSSLRAVRPEKVAVGKADTQDSKCSDRWKPTQEVIDFVRLSFPRLEFSRLIEGLGILYGKRGREINNMAVEDIVAELSDMLELTPALQESSANEAYSENPQEDPSTDFYDDEIEGNNAIPWKPPLPLVQVVRLSFPTEEL